jgi:hypothetical protein
MKGNLENFTSWLKYLVTLVLFVVDKGNNLILGLFFKG